MTTSAAKKLDEPCTIRRDGRDCYIWNLPRRLRRQFGMSAMVPVVTASGACILERRCGSMLIANNDGGMFRLPSGLMRVLIEMLRQDNMPYTVIGDMGAWPGPQVDGPFMFYRYEALLSAIAQRPELLAIYQAGRIRIVDLLIEICSFFYARRVFIVVARVDEGQALTAYLKERNVPVHFCTGASTYRCIESRVWVVTQHGLFAIDVDLASADIIVTVDALESLGKQCVDRLAYSDRARLIGLLSSDRQMSPCDRDRLQLLYGTCPITILRPGHITRDIRVVRIRIDRPGIHHGLFGLELKREGIWHHPARNRRIRNLARALQAGDHRRLDSDFPEVDIALERRHVRIIYVLVDSIEHAEVLADLLPDARVVDATTEPPSPSGLRGDIARRSHDYTLVIATPDGLPRLDLLTCDVLILANGGEGMPPGLHADALQALRDYRELLLIDIDDRHHPELRRQSRQRLRHYARAGWAIGADDRNGLAGFLLTRPEA